MFTTKTKFPLLLLLCGAAVSSYREDLINNVFEKYTHFINRNSTIDVATYLPAIKEAFSKVSFEDLLSSNKLNFTNSTMKCVDAFSKLNKQQLFTLFDATGKPGAGIAIAGQPKWAGSYDECMKNEGSHYCIETALVIAGKLPVMLGLCVPEVCNGNNINELMKFVANHTFSLIELVSNPGVKAQFGGDEICFSKNKSYSTGAYVMIVISVLIATLCLVGSITEIVTNFIANRREKNYILYVEEDDFPNETSPGSEIDVIREEKTRNISMHSVNSSEGNFFIKFLLCFSLIKNSKALFDTNVPPGAITAINGIRVLSIMWVIEGHALIVSFQSIDNIVEIYGWIPRFTMQAMLNAPVSVDTFFLLSGLLVGYLSMKRYQTIGHLPLLRYYLHRYIRLTPSYAYLIFFYTYVYPLLLDGPFSAAQGPNSPAMNSCKSYWWTNLLYINNLYPKLLQDECFDWSWYLANDMQFYVISPVILYCMYKLKWIGVFAANGVFLLACFITNGALLYTKDASPIIYNPKAPATSMFAKDTPQSRYNANIYVVPWTRMAPYLVGLILGYILITKTKYEGKMKYLFYGFGWLVAVGLGIAVVYGPYSAANYEWKEASMITYGVMFRFVWAVAVGWVIYACHNGYGGLVNDFLSWKAFIPLSRLSYAVYLIHILVLGMFFMSQTTLLHLTVLNLVYYTTSIVVLSFAAAYVVAVCIEYPVFNLEKLFLKF